MTQYELETQWIGDEGVAGVNFRFGDLVQVNKLEHRDEVYEVISLISVTPQTQFVVTRVPDERSLIVSQEDLEPLGKNSGRKLTLVPPGEKPTRHA